MLNGEGISNAKEKLEQKGLRVYVDFDILKEKNTVYQVEWKDFDAALLKLKEVKALIYKVANEEPYESVPVKAIHNLYYESFKESFLECYNLIEEISKKITKISSPWDVDKLWIISQRFYSMNEISYYAKNIALFVLEIFSLSSTMEWDRKYDSTHDRIRSASCNADKQDKKYEQLLTCISADRELVYQIDRIINPNPSTDLVLGSISNGMKQNLRLDILNGVFRRIEGYMTTISNVESVISRRSLLFSLNELILKTKKF